MRVMGIDPGLTRTGWAVVERSGGRFCLVEAGVVSTSPGIDIAIRLHELSEALSALLGRFAPDAVSYERGFFNRNVRTATSVGQASGVALAAAAGLGIPVTDHTPTAVKLTVTGNGGATKHQVQSMVAALLGLKTAPEPADAADACALAICQLQRAGLSSAVAAAGGQR